tara:strand:+ start:416 stop:601 length:186 start_codon:yes stop_codon:yes gene_type:complete
MGPKKGLENAAILRDSWRLHKNLSYFITGGAPQFKGFSITFFENFENFEKQISWTRMIDTS